MKRRTQRNYIIAGLCMILVIMGVGYAAFQSQLKISGTSNITSNWSVKITDIQSKVVNGTPTNASEPTHTDTTATFRTRLTNPGDTMQYDVTVLNEGDIDAKLDKITIPESTNPAIGFEVKGIEEGSLLSSKETALLTVIVKYNNVTEQPSNLTADLEVTLDYSQAPEGYVPPVPGPTIGGKVIFLASNNQEGLYEDEYENGKYTYKGTNPDNYIVFNDEIWRIISINSDGVIKIIKSQSIGNRAYDAVGGGYGDNNWGRPADINTYLNNQYLNSINSNKNKILPHTWNIGGIIYDNNDLNEQIESENSKISQISSVGIITVSEYLRANNNDLCVSMNQNNTNNGTCKTTNWMYNMSEGSFVWTLSGDATNTTASFAVNSYDGAGFVFNYGTISEFDVYPVVYLTSDLKLNGDGSSENPFVIVS